MDRVARQGRTPQGGVRVPVPYRSPAVHAELAYLYFDPVDLLPAEGQERWARPAEHQRMVDEAIKAGGLTGMPIAVA